MKKCTVVGNSSSQKAIVHYESLGTRTYISHFLPDKDKLQDRLAMNCRSQCRRHHSDSLLIQIVFILLHGSDRGSGFRKDREEKLLRPGPSLMYERISDAT